MVGRGACVSPTPKIAISPTFFQMLALVLLLKLALVLLFSDVGAGFHLNIDSRDGKIWVLRNKGWRGRNCVR